jgi:hypothetical protein
MSQKNSARSAMAFDTKTAQAQLFLISKGKFRVML